MAPTAWLADCASWPRPHADTASATNDSSKILLIDPLGPIRRVSAEATTEVRVSGSAARTRVVDGADGVDRVGLGWGLVGSISLDSRESERQPSRIARAPLH